MRTLGSPLDPYWAKIHWRYLLSLQKSVDQHGTQSPLVILDTLIQECTKALDSDSQVNLARVALERIFSLLEHAPELRAEMKKPFLKFISQVLNVQAPAFFEAAVFSGLASLSFGLNDGARPEDEIFIQIATLRFAESEDVWLRLAALRFLHRLKPSIAKSLVLQSWSEENSDLFFRSGMQKIFSADRDVAQLASVDKSALVRQRLADRLLELPEDSRSHFARKLVTDPSAQVRAACFIGARKAQVTVGELTDAILKETDPFALRVVIDELRVWNEIESSEIRQVLGWIARSSPNPAARRSASAALEYRWAIETPEMGSALAELEQTFGTLAETEQKKFSLDQLPGNTVEDFARLLGILAQKDFGFEITVQRKSILVRRGQRFGMRFWRILHEWRFPSPEKRQGHLHTVGRISSGSFRIPSAVLAELVASRVPGEPLFQADEGTWRPFLPLVDDFISCLNESNTPIYFYSAEGITQVTPPAETFQKLSAWWKLNSHFQELSDVRNQKFSNSEDRHPYLERIRSFGFQIEFIPHRPEVEGADPDFSRYFIFAIFPKFWQFATSPFSNSTNHLFIFSSITLILYLSWHVRRSKGLKKDRTRLGLVIGGWGSRGKSGTERLKVAMFNALSYTLTSKTTGCEPVLVRADLLEKAKSIPIFRPFGKSTIWEQVDVARFGARAGSDVFLWECMGLQPELVKILQKFWMKDDLSTITNTYLDHEDIQGPTGLDVARTMVEFIPENSTLLTGEELMLPILKEGARKLHTKLIPVSWKEIGLIPTEALARFEYTEHPANLALVLALGKTLGVDEDFLLKEIPQFVLPDIGALRTYSPVSIGGRTFIFSNGFSANDLFSAIQSWDRIGLNHPRGYTPAEWRTLFLNNRKDRMARAIAFAELSTVFDADRIVLAGSGVGSHPKYIRTAIEKWFDAIPIPKSFIEFETILNQIMTKLRLPQEAEAVFKAVRISSAHGKMNLPPVSDHLFTEAELLRICEMQFSAKALPHAQEKALRDWHDYEEYIKLKERAQNVFSGAQNISSLWKKEVRTWVWQKLEMKIVTLSERDQETRESLVYSLVNLTPPGYQNHIFGAQNIKGPGMLLVESWEEGEKVRLQLKKAIGIEALTATLDENLLKKRGPIALALLMEASQRASLPKVYEFTDPEEIKRSTMTRILDPIRSFFRALSEPYQVIQKGKIAKKIYAEVADGKMGLEEAREKLSEICGP